MSDVNRIIDDLGRSIGGLNGDIASLSQQITEASNSMGEAVKFIANKISDKEGGKDKGSERIAEVVEELTKQISELDDSFTVQRAQAGETVKSLQKIAEDLERRAKESKKDTAKETSAEGKMTEALSKATNKFEEVGKQFTDAATRIELALGSRSMGGGGGSGSGGSGGGGSGGGGSGGGRSLPPINPEDFGSMGEQAARSFSDEFSNKSRRKIASWMTEISALFIGGYGDIGQVLFSGVVRDVTDFRKEARKLAFEMEGINATTRGLQAQFADLGDVAKQTGKSVDVLQRLYLKNVGKGFKKQGDELKKVLKSGAYLSTMIGSNVDETGGMFADWNRMLGMSADMMSQLANDAKSIALSTGVTGDELLSAMKSSEGALKNLRNQGNMTSAAAKNIIEAMTVAKKLGVEDKAAGVLDMLTSTNKFLEGDSKTRNFILKTLSNVPGGSMKAMKGNVMNDPNAIKGMVKGMDDTIRQFTNGRAQSVKDMENLGEEERMRLSMLLQNVFGMEIYEYEGMYKSFMEQTKTLGDKFSELTAETNEQLYTTEQVKLAYQKMNDLMIGSSMTFANKFADATSKIKDPSDFQAAMAKTNAQMTKAERSNLLQMKEQAKKGMDQGGLGMTDADFARTAGFGESKEYADSLLIAAKSIQKQGKDKGIPVKDLSGEILKAFESGSVVDIKEVQEKIAEQQKKLGVKEKTSVDAITELSQNINALNEVIRKNLSGPIGLLIDTLGWVGLALIQVGLASGILYSRFGSLMENMSKYTQSLSNLGSKVNAGSFFDKAIRKKNAMNQVPGKTPGSYIFEWSSNIFSRMADRFARFFDNVAEKGFSGLWESIVSGFSLVRSKIWNGIRWIGDSIGGLWKKGTMKIFGKDGFGGFFTKGRKFFTGGKGISGFFENARKFLGVIRQGGVKGALSGIASGFRKVGRLARANPVAFALLTITDAVFGAVEGYKNAAKIFGVETKDLTTGMKISAGAAGGIVGALDGLTFGLLRLTGIARPLEVILSNIVYGFMMMGEGIKEAFVEWLPWINDAFGQLGAAFSDLGSQIALIFGINTEGKKWTAFLKLMKAFGKMIGHVLGGSLFALINILTVVVKVIQGVVWVFGVLSNAIKGVVNFISGAVSGFTSFVTDMFESLPKAFENAWSKITAYLDSWNPFSQGGQDAWGKFFRWESSGGAPTKPAMAEGGIVTKPTDALIGEAGPEAVIPLDKLDSMMNANSMANAANDKIKASDFSVERAAEMKKNLEKSNKSLNEMNKVMEKGRKSSEGLYVNVVNTEDLGAGSGGGDGNTGSRVLSSAISALEILRKGNLAKQALKAGAKEEINPLIKGAAGFGIKELAKKASGFMEKIPLVGRFFKEGASAASAANPFSTMGGTMGRAAGGSGAVAKVGGGLLKKIPFLGALVDFGFRKAEGQDTTQAVGGAVSGAGGAMAGAATGAALGSFVGPVGTAIGGVLGGILGSLGGGALFDASYKSINPDSEPKIEEPAKLSEENQKLRDANIRNLSGYSASPDPASEQNWTNTPEYMWDSKDQIDAKMHKQMEGLNSTSGFAESAAWASVDGWKGRGDATVGSSNMEELVGKANNQLEEGHRKRYVEDNKKELDAAEKSIKELNKKVMEESRQLGMDKPIEDMPSNKALQEAYAKRDAIKYGKIPEKYVMDSGPDPNMLYESREEAIKRAEGKAEQEREFIKSEEGRLEGLKSKRKEVRGRRSWGAWAAGVDPDKDELAYIDKQIAEVPLSVEKAQDRLKTWENEAKNPTRKVIGKNEWTGNSDTTVIFPEKYAEEAVDWQMRSGTQTVQNADGTSSQVHKSEWMHPMSIEPEAKMIPGARPTDAQHILSETPDTEIQAFAERKIKGNTESAINLAEKKASLEAKARLVGKLGKEGVKDFSGIEVETDVDLQKKMVTAYASWSKESEAAALDMKKSYDDLNASQGGAGRAGMYDARKENYTPEVIKQLRAEGIKSEKWVDAGAAGMVLSDRQYMREASKAVENSSTYASAAQGDRSGLVAAEANVASKRVTDVTDQEISEGVTRYGQNHPYRDMEITIAKRIRDSLKDIEIAKAGGREADLIDADDAFDNAMTFAVENKIIRAPKDSAGDEIPFFDSDTPEAIAAAEGYLKKFMKEPLIMEDKASKAAESTSAAMEQASSYHATPVGQHAIPAMRDEDEGVSDVQPVHLRDISESILRDKTGGEAGTNRLQSDELTRMEEVANKQYAEMQQINEGIQEMVRLLKPSGEKVGTSEERNPRTKFNTKQVNPSIYGQMKDGKPGSGPNRSVYKK